MYSSPLPLAKTIQASIIAFRRTHPGYSTRDVIQAVRVVETYFRRARAGDGPAEQVEVVAPAASMLPLEEAAGFLGMTPGQLYRMTRQGKIAAEKIKNRMHYHEADLREWQGARDGGGEEEGAEE